MYGLKRMPYKLRRFSKTDKGPPKIKDALLNSFIVVSRISKIHFSLRISKRRVKVSPKSVFVGTIDQKTTSDREECDRKYPKQD